MLNIVASYVYDPAGYIELDVSNETTSGSTRRRVSRIATLDGGAVFNDAGYSEADRTIELNWRSTNEAVDVAIDNLVQTYTRVIVATRDGVYLAAPEVFDPGRPISKLTLLVLSKLSS